MAPSNASKESGTTAPASLRAAFLALQSTPAVSRCTTLPPSA